MLQWKKYWQLWAYPREACDLIHHLIPLVRFSPLPEELELGCHPFKIHTGDQLFDHYSEEENTSTADMHIPLWVTQITLFIM